MLLLMLLFGIIQASVYFWSYQTGANAAREGARRYAVAPCGAEAANDQKVKDFVGGAASGTIAVSHSFVKSSGNTGAGRETGDQVTVIVTYSAPSIGGFLPAFPAVTKKASARVEDVQDCS
ncbi:hypothetical protein ASD30_07540 [Nocardioides sp. Root140]|nr:hypothetical protein ASD30_07540 [Nocardioides sp. Root140]